MDRGICHFYRRIHSDRANYLIRFGQLPDDGVQGVDLHVVHLLFYW